MPFTLEIDDARGFAPLRERIGRHLGIDASRVLVVPGCTYALNLAVQACVPAGGVVLVETPTYELLPRVVRLAGLVAREVRRPAASGFDLDPAAVGSQATDAKAILVTSPHNPSGRLLPEETLRALVRLAEDRGLFLIVDEVYLDFHPRSARSYASAASLSDKVVVAGSLTKAHGLANLRVGWLAGPPSIVEEATRWHELLADRIPAFDAQAGCLAFDRMEDLLSRARRASETGLSILRAFAREQGFELVDPGFGITAMLRAPEGCDTLQLAEDLRREDGVLVVPGEMFGAPGWLRVSVGIAEAPLREGLSILARRLR